MPRQLMHHMQSVISADVNSENSGGIASSATSSDSDSEDDDDDDETEASGEDGHVRN
jgi:hypothetical protein